MVRHMTMRGEIIDMNRLRSVNANTIAVGNANLNARGDIVGKNGVVLKTQEQIEAEWETNRLAREASIRPADIKSAESVAAVMADTRKTIVAEDQFFEPELATEAAPVVQKQTSRRKITESDR